MLENELTRLWQSSPKHERIKFEKSKLMLDVQASLNGFNKAVNRRDFLEIGVAILIVIPLFGYQIYRQPSYLAKFGAIWIVIYCLYVIYRLLKARKTKPSEDSTYLDYLKQNKVYLERQKNLLDSVLYWYVLPCLIGCAIMLTGILDLLNKPWQEIIRIRRVWISLSIFTAIGVFIPRLNKRAVKKELVPRINKVEDLICLMEEDV